MSLIRYIQKLQHLDALIRKKATGNQKEFCKKACMSRSALNDYLNEMKELGFPIEYDRQRATYYYKEDGRMVPKFFEKVLESTEMKEYNGGNHFLSDEVIPVNWLELFLKNNISPNISDLTI